MEGSTIRMRHYKAVRGSQSLDREFGLRAGSKPLRTLPLSENPDGSVFKGLAGVLLFAAQAI